MNAFNKALKHALIFLSALSTGPAMSDDISAIDFYANLPVVEGPFIGPIELPEKFRNISILRGATNALALLPESLELVGQPDPIFRLHFSSFPTQKSDQLVGHLWLVAQAVHDPIPEELRQYLAISYPGAALGRPKIDTLIRGDFVGSPLFFFSSYVTTLANGIPKVTDMMLFEANLKFFFLLDLAAASAVNSQADQFGVRMSDNVNSGDSGKGASKVFELGISKRIDCKWLAAKFFDTSTGKFGCPESAKFTESYLTQIFQDVQKCMIPTLKELGASPKMPDAVTTFMVDSASEICTAKAAQDHH
jgi:hypothetical protein